MAEDITPALLLKLQKSFEDYYKKSRVVSSVMSKVKDGTCTQEDAFRYANEIGNIQAKVFKNGLSSAVLPNGRMYFNIANIIINETLGNDFNLVSKVATSAMAITNKAVGISLKAQSPKLDKDRVKGIIDRLSSEENYDEVSWILNEPVKTFCRNTVDETVKTNAEFQNELGVKGVVIRTSEGNCCSWCEDLAGEYEIPAPSEVYQRHDNCKCTVEYKGKKLTAYTSKSGNTNTYRKI